MPLSSDAAIADVLRRVGTIALLGASANPERASNRVLQFLLARGYQVIPVNPALTGSFLCGQRVYGALADIPTPVDMVDVFRHARYLDDIVDDTLACGIGTLWTQLDVVDASAAERAEQHGICVIMDRCPAIEWPRLQQLGLL